MVVLEVCRTVLPSALAQALMLLAQLALTQEQLLQFPDRAFKHLAKVHPPLLPTWLPGR